LNDLAARSAMMVASCGSRAHAAGTIAARLPALGITFVGMGAFI